MSSTIGLEVAFLAYLDADRLYADADTVVRDRKASLGEAEKIAGLAAAKRLNALIALSSVCPDTVLVRNGGRLYLVERKPNYERVFVRVLADPIEIG